MYFNFRLPSLVHYTYCTFFQRSTTTSDETSLLPGTRLFDFMRIVHDSFGLSTRHSSTETCFQWSSTDDQINLVISFIVTNLTSKLEN